MANIRSFKELRVEFALRCKYLIAEDAEILDGCYEQILGQLVAMIENPGAWIVGSNRKVNH